MEMLTIANQKGGTGKSTTAHALGKGLMLKGYSVLFIDMDAQCNLSFSMRADTNGITTHDILKGQATAKKAIQHTEQGDIIPASPNLSGADMEITGKGKEYKLKHFLEPLKEQYDYIIIDTPPALGILTINALTASDSVIILAQADAYSLQGIGQLYGTIETVRAYSNPGLSLKGILLTRHNARSVLTRDLTEMIAETAEQLNTKLFTTTIRENIAVKEAQASRMDIFSYAPRSNAAKDYRAFIEELLEGGAEDGEKEL